MNRNKVYNFSAGPSVLPEEVLSIAGREIANYNGTGMSVMEMSHRSRAYQSIFDETKRKLKDALSIPDSHEILFLQGGATLQFSAIPLNLIGENGVADYAVTGYFSNSAAKEAGRYGVVNTAVTSADRNHTYIPAQEQIVQTPGASYFYYCANNTVFGTEWKYVPITDTPLVCDMSSNILSKPVDVSKYGVIFAGAQKNMAPAGLTVVIIDRTLAGMELPCTPLLMSYKKLIESDSMYNTPPCYSIYLLGLVLDWLESRGGVAGMESIKREKAKLLYDFIDGSGMFNACAKPEARSDMNITFSSGDKERDADFVKAAEEIGLLSLKGHRAVGGMRASVYNAMPESGVRALVEFMQKFELSHQIKSYSPTTNLRCR